MLGQGNSFVKRLKAILVPGLNHINLHYFQKRLNLNYGGANVSDHVILFH